MVRVVAYFSKFMHQHRANQNAYVAYAGATVADPLRSPLSVPYVPLLLHCWHTGINKGLQDGSLKPYAGPTFKLAEAPASHVEVIEHKLGSKGKIILTIRDESGKTEL